jgi:ATP-dependent helicase/nuclease subunit A
MVDFEDLEYPQQLAALAHDRNYAVTAGAGSGKTTTFAMRYLKLLEQTNADPHSIGAITFTESGATELEERVRSSVSDRLSGLDGEEYDRWREYHDALPEAYVHTIHGFCSRLLREYALEADVPVGFDVIEETAARGHQLETVERFVEENLEDPRIERLTELYYRDRLEELLGDLLAEHHDARQWADEWADRDAERYLAFVQERYSPIDPNDARDRLGRTSVQNALGDLQQVAAEEDAGQNRIGIARNVAAAVETHGGDERPGLPVDALDDVEIHDAAAAICEALTADGTPYNGGWDSWAYDRHSDWAHANGNRYEAATTELIEALPVEEWAIPDRLGVDRNAGEYYVALASLFQDLHGAYEERKRRENVLDFADLIDGAIELLRTSPDVREDLRETFDHVMLDEVQDTDPRQWELVELLTSLDDEYDRLNVFVVGDEKQSIFRFRGADVTQYRAERMRLAGANERAVKPPLDSVYENAGERDLSVNFRSLPSVIEPINGLFDEVFGSVPEVHRNAPPGIDGDATEFEPDPQALQPDRSDPSGVGTETTFVAVPEEEEVREAVLDAEHPLRDLPDDSVELDARALAGEVASLLDGDTQRYEQVEGNEAEDGPMERPTDLEPSDVAILLRKRTHLETYERALASLNVPYTVASGIGFYDSPEIVALRNLFSVLQDPNDDLALFGVLRSPLFGFEDPTVVGLWEDVDRNEVGSGELWAALERTDHEELSDARECIERWRVLAGANGPTTVVETWDALLGRIIEDTGFLASLAVGERGQQAVANVEKLRSRLRGWSEDGLQTLPALVERIEREIELSTREGEATVPEDADGVRIMTIHDAKGREFPAVFVPGISKDFNLKAGYGEGIAEFETVADPVTGERTPLLGIKGLSVGDAFEEANTTLKRRLEFQRKREAVAEEKRILYVAMTRARDHLRLVGTVGCDGEDLGSLETGDGGDPSNWYDLVGECLWDEEVVSELAKSGSAFAHFDADGSLRIRLPESAGALELTERSESPELEVDIDGGSIEPEYSIPASSLGSLIEDDAPGNVVIDHTGRYLSYRPPEHGGGGHGSKSGSEGLPRNVLGDVVHKAIELGIDPSEETAFRRLAEQFADREDVDRARIRTGDIVEMQQHVRTAIDYLDELEGSVVDEKPVRANLESGEVYGDIDHLVVSEDVFHIVDYKTNSIAGAGDIEDLARHYRWQMAAYAASLHEADPFRSVEATLLFSDQGLSKSFAWNPDELEQLGQELDSELRRQLLEHV